MKETFYVLVVDAAFTEAEEDKIIGWYNSDHENDQPLHFKNIPTRAYMTFYDDRIDFSYDNEYFRNITDDPRCWTIRGNTVDGLFSEISDHLSNNQTLPSDGYLVKVERTIHYSDVVETRI